MQQKSEQKTVEIRKSTLVLIICLCGVLAMGTIVGVVRAFGSQEKYGSLEQLARTVEENYYTDVDKDAAMDGALKGYVSGLEDPYSRYMTEEEYASFQTSESGQMVGIGVTVTQTEDGYLLVNSVTADSPAEEAGIQAADVILRIDGEDAAALGYAGAVEAVRGEEGTSVAIAVQREEKTLEMNVVRKNMEVVTAQGVMLQNKIGYLRISAFKENTPEQFQAAFTQLLEDGAEGFVFDLRDNGGGLVTSLEKILDPLLPEGEIAVATYRNGSTKTLVESDAEECDLPMVVLVNGNTASAAELFTASLQDFGKAQVVGTTTYGKGVMQVTQRMPEGGALTLTVATYRTVRGECYHGTGIAPDVAVEAGEKPFDENHPDEKVDPQLKAALELFREG